MSWDKGRFPAMRMEAHYGNRVVECFEERPTNLFTLLADAVARDPVGEALVVEERRYSWSALGAVVDRTARALSAQGLRRGDRVAMVMGNSEDFILALFAIFRIGAVVVPISIRSSRPEVAYAINNCTARILLHDSALSELVPAKEDCAGCVAIPFPDLSGDGDLPPLSSLPKEDEVALILHTSGTTGKPKGAMLTHLSLIHSALYYEATMQLTAEDRIIASVPLNHVTGIAALIATPIRAGATLILMKAFDARSFLDLAEAERMTYTMMVPAMYNLCLLRPDFPERDLATWRLAAYGGAPMPEPTIRGLAKAIPGLEFANCYGATETIVAQLMTPPDFAYEKREYVGCPLPGTQAVIMDPFGCEVPAGTEGELWLRGPNVVLGYWNDPEATARAFVGGFWRSGDIGCADADGFVRVLDRAKDMINRGGLKIYSAELENVLTDHPAVIEAAAVAKHCPVLGERVHAVVVVKSEVEDEALKAWCRERLSDYKVPESLDISTQPLPRVPNGKIDKKLLRDRIADESVKPN